MSRHRVADVDPQGNLARAWDRAKHRCPNAEELVRGLRFDPSSLAWITRYGCHINPRLQPPDNSALLIDILEYMTNNQIMYETITDTGASQQLYQSF